MPEKALCFRGQLAINGLSFPIPEKEEKMKTYLLGFYDYLDLDTVFKPVAVIKARNESSALKKARKVMQEKGEIGDCRFEHAGFSEEDGQLQAEVSGSIEGYGTLNKDEQTFRVMEISLIP